MALFRDLLYRVYERVLEREVLAAPLPQHVGLILDGNRRFARSNGEDAASGHKLGADKMDEVLAWAEDLGIPTITAWILSIDNLDRPASELAPLIEIIEQKVSQLALAQADMKFPRRIRGFGRLDLLSPSTREALALAEERTAEHGPWALNFAVGYGGREEIADAVKLLLLDAARQGRSVEEAAAAVCPESISRYLYTAEHSDPDLIIRTSGEVRLGGFMLWQSVYSEFYFCDVYWPAFRRIDFLRAVRSYQDRHQRRGR
ncbi:MAG: di-trans,poly-cis-decaprenylcistransferase [Dehalococcoidia bacterium]|nr:di-trans,poly-cis-decaprenylcistransferase [Dehalococcoidia bacterium]